MRIAVTFWITILFYMHHVCSACVTLNPVSGSLTRYHGNTYSRYSECWFVPVPEDSYISIRFGWLHVSHDCHKSQLKITEAITGRTINSCSVYLEDLFFIALNNITISYLHDGSKEYYAKSNFTLNYVQESLICTRANHFRCSTHQCIHKSQVCDRRIDCENASDEKICDNGIMSIVDAKTTQNMVLKWLVEKSVAYGWGKDTPRAITALYLAQANDRSIGGSSENHLKKELEIRQLELRTLVGLLRNFSEPISVGELSMFVNALITTCHNPRQFHGYDLVRILYERASTAKMPCPGAYLTLCNSNWKLSPMDVRYLIKLLQKDRDFPFVIDIQAMTIMALSCIRNKYEEYENLFNDTSTYNETIEKFIESQLPDGSFGNVYTTALITQSLISSDQESNKQWNIASTVKYFKKYFDSLPMDFLSVYLVLPLLSSKSLVDIGNVNCLNSYRKQDSDISDVTESLDEKMFIQYSLFIGDEGDIVHTIYLKMPKNCSAYDVMRVAQTTDPKYKFLHRFTSGQMYVYQIADITNDPEAGKFWLLYTKDIKDTSDKTVESHKTSPDKLILKDGEHLVMWYKTALI